MQLLKVYEQMFDREAIDVLLKVQLKVFVVLTSKKVHTCCLETIICFTNESQ